MRFKCAFCSCIIEQNDSFRGYKITCPNCSKSIMVPINRYETGCIIGDFMIEEKIGEGSIGAVYKAVQLSLDRIVALKILYPEYTNTKGIADFLKEARAAAKLNHTNIVQSLAVGEENGICYMAMTYITGETLKAKMKREGKILVDESLHIAQQVAEALYYAWDEAKIIHRDVKPDNIMITDDGIVKLTDLGLAMHQKDWNENMEISGSPSYMSPEQFAGEKLDSRSDIYSLGVTLYQMLSGTLPFDGATLRTVASQHFEQNPVPLNKLIPGIPPKVVHLVKKMMEKLPEDRFATMEELLKNIWTIRQKTAPDKDLVPDVHTISINRLDYSYQQDYVTKAKENKSHDMAIRSLSEASILLYKSLLITSIVIVAILVGVIIYIQVPDKETARFKKEFDIFKTQIESGDFSQRQLEKNANILIKQMEPFKSPEIKVYQTAMKLGLVEMENKRLLTEARGTLTTQKQLEKELIALKKELSELQSKNEVKDTAKATAVPDFNTEKLLAENKVLNEKIKALNAAIDKLSLEYEESWKRELNMRIYALINNAFFKESAAFLENESLKRKPVYKKWFSDKIAWLDRMEKIYNLLNFSGSKLSGAVINDDIKIIMIDEGQIHYNDTNSSMKIIPFAEMSVDNLSAIAKRVFDTIPDDELKADIALMKGNLGAALRQSPFKNKNAEELCSAAYAQAQDRIKYFSMTDKKKNAYKLMHSILKNLEGAPNYDKIKTELRRLLPEEE